MTDEKLPRANIRTVNKAIQIAGHYPMPLSNGRALHVLEFTAVRGKWRTNALTEDLSSHVYLRDDWKARVTAWALSVIAREDEIRAARARQVRAFMDR